MIRIAISPAAFEGESPTRCRWNCLAGGPAADVGFMIAELFREGAMGEAGAKADQRDATRQARSGG
jgi:hypothetical protein